MGNEEKFTGKSKVYDLYRPSYPSELLDCLIKESSLLSTSRIADIGSGTGILTKQLLEKGFTVLGVEPNSEMRHIAEQKLKSYSLFISVAANAESTMIDANSIDLITVAQAFHWFDIPQFKKECRIILNDKGKIALISNSRDLTDPLIQENEQICARYCPNFKGYSQGIEETPEIYSQFFKNGEYEIKVFKNDQLYNLQHYIGRNLSSSFAPKEGDATYELFIEALTAQFHQYAIDGVLVFPLLTKCYIGKVK